MPWYPQISSGSAASTSQGVYRDAAGREKYQLPIDTVAFDFAILRPDEERKATAEKHRMDPSVAGCSSRGRAGMLRNMLLRNHDLGNCTHVSDVPYAAQGQGRHRGGHWPTRVARAIQVPHTAPVGIQESARAASSTPRAIRRTSSCSSACLWPRSTTRQLGSRAWLCRWTTTKRSKIWPVNPRHRGDQRRSLRARDQRRL